MARLSKDFIYFSWLFLRKGFMYAAVTALAGLLVFFETGYNTTFFIVVGALFSLSTIIVANEVIIDFKNDVIQRFHNINNILISRAYKQNECFNLIKDAIEEGTTDEVIEMVRELIKSNQKYVDTLNEIVPDLNSAYKESYVQ